MGKITLNQILNLDAITLEHDNLELRIVPFNTKSIAAWNATQIARPAEGQDPIEFNKDMLQGQLSVVAEHLQRCVVKGNPERVTSEWLETEFPQTVLQSLALFLVEGTRPAWAPESEGKKLGQRSR